MAPGIGLFRDDWLDPWLPRLRDAAQGLPVLELGCGRGADTATLVQAGFSVVGFDLDPDAVAQARLAAPTARLTCQDLRAPFPLAPGAAGAVVASLSLHYFAWTETLALFDRVRAALHPGGVLLCRLNSTRDHHFGASGHPAIEPDYYLVDGQPKRFFDEAAARAVVAQGWQLQALAEKSTAKYGDEKWLWELAARRIDPATR